MIEKGFTPMAEPLCFIWFDSFHPKFTNDVQAFARAPLRGQQAEEKLCTQREPVLGSERLVPALRVSEFWYLAFRKLLKHLPDPAENVLLKETNHINLGPMLR